MKRKRGRTISAIFAASGEPYFRQVESGLLERQLADSRKIVSTGGGAVLAAVNRERMKARGFVVALTATAERIIERVSADTNRPLLQGGVEQRVHKLLAERKHAYDFADIAIDTTDLNVEAVADHVMAGLPDEFIV